MAFNTKKISLILAAYQAKLRQRCREYGFPPNSEGEELVVTIATQTAMDLFAEIMNASKKEN